MHLEILEPLIRVLQASISPVALVSGVGLLILSQTNRFSIVTDRLRRLLVTREELHRKDPKAIRQIEVLMRRAHILRSSINAAVLCVLLASLMILLMFAMAAFNFSAQSLILLLFCLSLISLIVSLVLFMRDTHLSLEALKELSRD